MNYIKINRWQDVESGQERNSYIPISLVYALGIPVIIEWKKNIEERWPKARLPYVDCGPYPGLVLNALRHHLTPLAFRGDPQYYAPLKSMADESEIELIFDPPWPLE